MYKNLFFTLPDIEDVPKMFPCLLTEMKTWFKSYKGKNIVNTIGLNEEVKNQEFAICIINKTHCLWKQLMKGEAPPNIRW